MTRRILCFGDSNTYGFNPEDPIENRYPPTERWPEILAARTGWEAVNMGVNGRRIPHAKKEVELAVSQIQEMLPADCIIIMLGSNDIDPMGYPSADKIASRMRSFLSTLKKSFPELSIYLVAPPQVEIPLAHIQEVFWELAPKYRQLAITMGIHFASAISWRLPLSPDGAHLSAEAHSAFATEMEKLLKRTLENVLYDEETGRQTEVNE